MVHNHAEAISMKVSIKLNIVKLEKAECILTGSKLEDKNTINSLIDNILGLINKSRLQPTHQQEMTRILLKMKRDHDKERHLELEKVLNRIITVFSAN